MNEYIKSIATAKKLIEKKGRPFILQRNLSISYTSINQPWDGVGTSLLKVSIIGVFLNYKQLYFSSTIIKAGDQKLLVAADSLGDLIPSQSDIIVDCGATWQVINIDIVKPGTEVIMYSFQLRK